MIELRGLTPSGPDLELLREFYNELYVREFPDPDERESLENMVGYIKAVGTNDNGYHIVVATDSGRPVGGSITDYFARSNAGVIEFILVASDRRETGLGTRLLADAESRLMADATRCAHEIAFVAAEINDPFLRGPTPDNVEPFTRVRWWDARGYGRLDFPYVQPPLSAEQHAVRNLMLCAKSFAPRNAISIPARSVDAFVRDYLVYAMRLAEPHSSPEYRAMTDWLARLESVSVVGLRRYIGEDGDHPMKVQEIDGSDKSQLDAVLSVYRAAFQHDDTAIDVEEFRRLLQRRVLGLPFSYHLWGLKDPRTAAIAGLASFYTLPSAGFGGYVALVPPLLRTGALSSLLARIEQQMALESQSVRGWYIECETEQTASIFAARGFLEVAARYVQPLLRPTPQASPDNRVRLHLLYREFGPRHTPPLITSAEFIAQMSEIFRYVYDVPPESLGSFRSIAEQARGWVHVPFGLPVATPDVR